MANKLLILYCVAGLHGALSAAMLVYHVYCLGVLTAARPRYLALAYALLAWPRLAEQASSHRLRVYAYLAALLISVTVVTLAYLYLPTEDPPRGVPLLDPPVDP